jgi:hypothetical protein
MFGSVLLGRSPRNNEFEEPASHPLEAVPVVPVSFSSQAEEYREEQ